MAWADTGALCVMEGGIRKSHSLSRLAEISAVLDTDEKSSFTFSKAGTYPYFCSIHPEMTGRS